MAKGRKNGCPVNIRNWLVYIQDNAAWKRIYGLTSLTWSIDSDTEDGSSATDDWSEPYITKRSGSLSLEGKEVVEEATGVIDEGQDLLNSYADKVGCDGDATLKFVDPYGHSWIGDYIVTGREVSSDDSGTNLSWDLEQVGEIEVQPYVNVTSIALKEGDTAKTALSLTVGGAASIINVAFTPATASNQRFRITNTKRSVCTIGNITEDGFTVTPVSAGTSTITVTTVEGAITATLTVTVAAGS